MKSILTIGFTFSVLAAIGQAGSLDPTFNVGSGADQAVNEMALAPDGKVLIVGSFTTYNAVPRSRIARVNSDGSLDTSFDLGAGANDMVISVALQADGKILVGGVFTSINGVLRDRIARLNADGTVDLSFTPVGANNQVRRIIVQPDGKILISGTFTNYGGSVANSIVRLNSDGSRDMTFDPGTGATDAPPGYYYPVKGIALQTDGKILIGGLFTKYNGTPQNKLARINTNGSLDTTFHIGSGPDADVNEIEVLPNGKVLIGGNFTTYNGYPIKSLVKLESNGTLDNSFIPVPSVNGFLESIAVQPDGMILFGGTFNQTQYTRLARVDAMGTADPDFAAMPGANQHVRRILVQPDGNILICGGFSEYDNVHVGYFARVQGFASLLLKLTTDASASETTWQMTDVNDVLIAAGGPYADGDPMVIMERIPFTAGCFKFAVYDAGGNGITDGGYVLSDNKGNRLVDANGLFGSVSTTGYKFCYPVAPIKILAGCDDLDHSSSVPITCSQVPGAVKYQFLAYDPHGSIRISTTSVNPQVGPNRLAHIPVGLELNIRARAQYSDSSYSRLGPVCTFMMSGSGMAPQELRSTIADAGSSMSIWPNPLEQEMLQLNLNGLATDVTTAEVKLLDALGRITLYTAVPVANGAVYSTINLGDVSNGMYVLQVTTNGKVMSTRLSVNR